MSTAEGTGSIPGWGTKSLQATIPQVQPKQNKTKPSRKNTPLAPAPPLNLPEKGSPATGRTSHRTACHSFCSEKPSQGPHSCPSLPAVLLYPLAPTHRKNPISHIKHDCPLSTEQETEAQRGELTCPRSHSEEAAKLHSDTSNRQPRPPHPRPRTPRAPSQSKQKGGGAGWSRQGGPFLFPI